MKKYLYSLFTLILLLMICACGQEDVDDVQVSNANIADHIDPVEETEPIQEVELIPEAETNAPAEDGSDMIQEEEMNVTAEVETAILPEEEKAVYEAYMKANAGTMLYAYFDYDNDGKQELYLRSGTYGQVWKYVDGGLKTIDGGNIISGDNINGLEWNEIEKDDSDDSADSEERVHGGVYVYVEQNPSKERDEWYVKEQDFLSRYGFGESDPFYEYALPDGSMRLVLYYDEATGLGCGLRYYQRDPDEWATSGVYGFSFIGLVEESNLWTDRLNVDYTKFESWTGVYSSSWDENIEYDDAGRVAHYEAYAPVDGEQVRILNMYYEYDDNGTLRQRRYYHYHLKFSSTFQYWYSYFDELGRVEYERAYITHGSLEYYYIYLDGSDEPAYSLFLDKSWNWWIPDFAKL